MMDDQSLNNTLNCTTESTIPQHFPQLAIIHQRISAQTVIITTKQQKKGQLVRFSSNINLLKAGGRLYASIYNAKITMHTCNHTKKNSRKIGQQ
jgi:hypothetical protein